MITAAEVVAKEREDVCRFSRCGASRHLQLFVEQPFRRRWTFSMAPGAWMTDPPTWRSRAKLSRASDSPVATQMICAIAESDICCQLS